MIRRDTATQTILLTRPGSRQYTRAALILSVITGSIIFVLPFHGFLTVFGADLGLDYTMLRLWKEFLLLMITIVCLALAVAWYFWQQGSHAARIKKILAADTLITLMLVYLGLILFIGFVNLASARTSATAAAFGMILDARFILFFLVTLFLSRHTDWLLRHWRGLVLIPAAAVVVFGIAQYFVLPPDFLARFGYGPETIPAVQTVDQKLDYQRIQSTLRGANPLGAYLILILTALGGLVAAGSKALGARKEEGSNWRKFYVALFALALAALVLTFSRSAWIGMAAAAFMLAWLVLPTEAQRRRLAVGTVVLIVVFGGLTMALRDNDAFQNTIFHTDEHSASAESSNEGHFEATSAGVRDMFAHPLGGGVGSAGPASVYNGAHGPRIAENYFVQVGQELGLAGLALFIAINVYIIRALWTRRSQLLPRILLASFVGITGVNMFMHAWTDDTISYIWWGLAGAALAVTVSKKVTVKKGAKA